ncbi:MAG: preprotein translocase subunit SecE [Clostridia bacterium]|nr:preprotein translocase subunit SecE [Clostridia bacterium]
MAVIRSTKGDDLPIQGKEANTSPKKSEQAPKKSNDKKPGKFASFFIRIRDFFKGLKSEFKKITWASGKSTLRNFVLVLVIVVIAAVVIGLLDWGLGGLFNAIFKGINELF